MQRHRHPFVRVVHGFSENSSETVRVGRESVGCNLVNAERTSSTSAGIASFLNNLALSSRRSHSNIGGLRGRAMWKFKQQDRGTLRSETIAARGYVWQSTPRIPPPPSLPPRRRFPRLPRPRDCTRYSRVCVESYVRVYLSRDTCAENSVLTFRLPIVGPCASYKKESVYLSCPAFTKISFTDGQILAFYTNALSN